MLVIMLNSCTASTTGTAPMLLLPICPLLDAPSRKYSADESRLPLLEMTLPGLQQMSPGQRNEFRDQVEALIAADGKLSIFEYALRCVVARSLAPTFASARRASTRRR